jgi:hypothetical protein
MSKVKVASFGVSIDGFSAGPRQSIDDPLGVGGPSLMNWFFPTRTFQQMHGGGGGEAGIDDDFAVRGFANVDATQRRRLPPAVTCASAAARPRSASTCRPG